MHSNWIYFIICLHLFLDVLLINSIGALRGNIIQPSKRYLRALMTIIFFNIFIILFSLFIVLFSSKKGIEEKYIEPSKNTNIWPEERCQEFINEGEGIISKFKNMLNYYLKKYKFIEIRN